MSDSMLSGMQKEIRREVSAGKTDPGASSGWENPGVNEVRVVMKIPEGAVVIFDRPVAHFFTYWIQLTAPFLVGDIGHALCFEFFQRTGRALEA